MKIILPWPDKRLSPNARVHFHALRRAKKTAREASHVLTLAAGGLDARSEYAGDFGIPMRILFYPPDRRARDADNALSSMKAYLDGIADALHVNDSRFVPQMEMMDDTQAPGRVEVLL